ncbi:MAG: J domain-containing protein [Pyrinomonadaceae bacterium]|nr:J domain-containing protein [Pyrinomonadaceae bacterium]
MVDYYHILGVKPDATAAEIKTAYRRLARKMHPDLNGDNVRSAQDFAKISKAYQLLSNPTERQLYDTERLKSKTDDSVILSDNPHARRLRRVAIQRRMDAAVDRFIAQERQETFELQQAVFPVVALFLSTFFVGMFKPQVWANSDLLGKAVLITLFLIGLWHLLARLNLGLKRYTRSFEKLHDSVLREEEEDEKPYSRFTAIAFLVVGVGVSLGIGYLIGKHLEVVITAMMPRFFVANLNAELIFYPPIAVLIIDAMHAISSKADL